MGVVVGVVGRGQDRKRLGTSWVPTGQILRCKDKDSAIGQAQKQAVTEFRTPGVHSDGNLALHASGTPEKPKIRNQQNNPLVYPPYTPSQRYPKCASTDLGTIAPEFMGCYGPAEAEHHVTFPGGTSAAGHTWGTHLNPTSIVLVVALDFGSATKMDVAENRARTVVLPSVAYHGGGATGHKTLSRLSSTPSKVRVGGSCSPTNCISPWGSPQLILASPLPLRRWRGPSWWGPAAALPSEGTKY